MSGRILILTLYVCLLAPVAFGQSTTRGGLRGTVSDQTGAGIAGASVALDRPGLTQLTTLTSDGGKYAFDDLLPGAYTVTVHFEGFLDYVGPAQVRARAPTSLNVSLKIGFAVVADVTVAEPGALSTDPAKNLSALVLRGGDIESLPDDPQRFLQRILELAGSTGRPDDVTVYVNGFREYKRFPPKSAIQMIRINSNPYSAEFSQPTVKRVEIVTKAGSDSLHGDVRLQGRHSALDARNPMAETKPPTRNWSYNGYLQAPIVKGRFGFFAYAGEWKQDEQAFVHATVLDPATFRTEGFATAVSAPTGITSALIRTDFSVRNQMINFSYGRTDETHRNEALQGGFDLPEHAYDRSSQDDIGRFWWTYVGSRHAVNDVRVEVSRTVTSTVPLSTSPEILVLDAFNAGGNQDASTRLSVNGFQASETLTVQSSRHNWKIGGELERAGQHSIDRSGFGGTFVFGADVERSASGNPLLNAAGQATPISPIENYRRTLLGVPGYTASSFRIVTGNPHVTLNQWHVGWFATDDWSLSKRLTASYGVRQELQTNVGAGLNLAPRGAVSWLLDAKGKNAIKLGAGLFYSRVDPEITFQTRKVNGSDRQQFIIERPAFLMGNLPSSGELVPTESAIYTMSPDLKLPFSFMTTIGYERQLPGRLFAVAQYLYSRGFDQLRLRNLSGPSPIFQFESTGRSLQREFMVGLRGNISADLTLYGNYTLGKKYSDTDGAYTMPANSNDLSAEYGFAADDQRHRFVAGATAAMGGGLSISPAVSISSGRPFNITTGSDNNGDSLFTDRPAFARAGDAGVIVTRYGVFNPNPQSGDTIIPRNLGREPMQVSMDLNITQSLFSNLFIGIDSENLLNQRRLIKSNNVVTSPLFGVPNQALNGRRLELTIRYGF